MNKFIFSDLSLNQHSFNDHVLRRVVTSFLRQVLARAIEASSAASRAGVGRAEASVGPGSVRDMRTPSF